jgi:hypothetical protein
MRTNPSGVPRYARTGLVKVNLQEGKETGTFNPSIELHMQAFYLQNIADMESANRSLTIDLSRTSGPYCFVVNSSEQMITVIDS